MPLTRDTVTVASRIMLPVYVAFFAVLGLNYLASPRDRLVQTPALEYANRVLDLHVWGMVFLVAASLMAEALLLRRRRLYQGALLVCAASMAVWASVNLFAAFRSDASPAGAVWPTFVVAACLASFRSLGVKEIS